MLWKENDKPDDEQGLGGFFRYSYAHGDVSEIEHFWSLGMQYEGLIPTRDKDVLAFGFAQSMDSTQYRHEIDSRADRESIYELYYAIKVTPWLVITPDIQVITNPGANKDGRDALVGGLRFKVAL
jgi:porin